MSAHFKNPDGYELREASAKRIWWWPFVRRIMYRVTMDGAAPLTWVDDAGNEWRTVRSIYDSDLGSVPELTVLAVLGITKDSALRSYLFHDEAYQPGHVMLCKRVGAVEWEPVTVTKAWADEQLRLGAIAEGNYAWQARAIWWGVDRFGNGAWNQ